MYLCSSWWAIGLKIVKVTFVDLLAELLTPFFKNKLILGSYKSYVLLLVSKGVYRLKAFEEMGLEAPKATRLRYTLALHDDFIIRTNS